MKPLMLKIADAFLRLFERADDFMGEVETERIRKEREKALKEQRERTLQEMREKREREAEPKVDAFKQAEESEAPTETEEEKGNNDELAKSTT